MTDLTKKELVSILKTEFKDRPLNSDLEKFATKDGLTRLEERFDGLEQRIDGLEKKVDHLDERIDDMGKTIVDAIERGMGIKADRVEVVALTERVSKIEKIVSLN